MDNHYVPNLTIGPLVCDALRKHGVTADIDVHLMVKPVDRIIPDFAKAGATYITFHPEGSEHVDRTLQLIHDEGCKSGLVFNPATPLDYLTYVLDKVDMVLLMSVNPGFGGQSSSLRHWTSCARHARLLMLPVATFAWKSTVVSRWITSVRLPRPVRIRLSPVRRFSVLPATVTPMYTTVLSRPCATSWPRPEPVQRVLIKMSIAKPEMILIDVDGTLVDSVPDLAFCVDSMMEQLGRKPRGEAHVRNWVGNGVERLVKRALIGQLDGEPDENEFARAYPVFLDLYADNTSKRSVLYPGVREGLDYLRTAGYALGCVTNKAAQFTLPLLKDLGVYDDFAIVVSGDTLQNKKPHPEPLLHAAEFFKVEPARALMVGDSISDVKAARAAGFQVVCVPYGYNHGEDIRTAEPDAVIATIADLKTELEKAA